MLYLTLIVILLYLLLNIINIIINIDSRLNKLRVEIIYLPVPCDGNFTILFGQTGDKFDRFTFLDRLKRKILMIVVTINRLKVEHMGEEYNSNYRWFQTGYNLRFLAFLHNFRNFYNLGRCLAFFVTSN